MNTDKKMFRDARRTLDERAGRGPREALKAWDETWNDYVKRRQAERREALLNEHVPKRRCALCGVVKLRSRQWIELDSTQQRVMEQTTGKRLTMVCKGCKMRMIK